MSNIIYLPIKTPGGFYIYDRSVNTIFAVSQDEYREFCLLHNSPKLTQSPVITKYRKLGLLKDNNVTLIHHPATNLLPHYCSNRLNYLILQVTQQCNLRCSYCAYSGLYYNREHSSAKMSFAMAKKAIDFFIERAKESSRLHFAFYGGEPLLEFDLIKKCVAYIRDNVEGKEVSFGMTTNGTMLTDEKIAFIAENKFQLMISLDGSKEEHDACRVFPNGKGSFDIIIRNIQRVKELYPDYSKRIKISTVISPKSELNHMLDYFKSDEVLSDKHIMMSTITSTGLKEQVDYKESFHLVRKYEYLKYLLYILGKIDKQYVSELVIRSQQYTEETYHSLQTHTTLPECTCPGGPCIPSIKKLFVTTEGKFYPCEKVSESSDYCQIGSLNSGFDMRQMEVMLNLSSLTKEECKNCWAISLCKICAAQIDYKEGQKAYTKEAKLLACKRAKQSAANNLYEACVLHEFGYRPNEEGIVL